jgi:opacity protein-like surface antigen
MKKFIRTAKIAAVLMAAPLFAAAAQPGNYAAGHLGANHADHWSGTVDFGAGVKVPGSLDLDPGLHLGAIVGKQTENARFDLEWQHGRFDVSGAFLGGVSNQASGSGHYDALTVNAYRLFALSPRWTAFAGAGIGWGRASLPRVSVGACNCFPASSKGGFAYQVRVGADYELSQGNQVFAQLGWLSLAKIDGGSPGVSYSRREVPNVGIGYRKAF